MEQSVKPCLVFSGDPFVEFDTTKCLMFLRIPNPKQQDTWVSAEDPWVDRRAIGCWVLAEDPWPNIKTQCAWCLPRMSDVWDEQHFIGYLMFVEDDCSEHNTTSCLTLAANSCVERNTTSYSVLVDLTTIGCFKLSEES